MAKGLRLGESDVARKGKKGYFGVGDIAKKIKKMYVGDDDGLARLGWTGGGYELKLAGSAGTYYRTAEEVPATFTTASTPTASGNYYFYFDPANKRFYATGGGTYTYSPKIYYNSSLEDLTWTYAGQISSSGVLANWLNVDPTDGALIYLDNVDSPENYICKTTVSSNGLSTIKTTQSTRRTANARVKKVGPYYLYICNDNNNLAPKIEYTTSDFNTITEGGTDGQGQSATYLCADYNPALFYTGSSYILYRFTKNSDSSTGYYAEKCTSNTISFSFLSQNNKKVISAYDRSMIGNITDRDAIFFIADSSLPSTGFNSKGTWSWSGKISSSSPRTNSSYAVNSAERDENAERIFVMSVYSSSAGYIGYCDSNYVWTMVSAPNTGMIARGVA